MTLALIRDALKAEHSVNLVEDIELHKTIVQHDPKNEQQSLNAIAGLYGSQKNFAEEVTWAKKAIEIDPKFVLGYINYGTGLASSGKLDEARTAYNKAKQLDPNYAITDHQLRNP